METVKEFEQFYNKNNDITDNIFASFMGFCMQQKYRDMDERLIVLIDMIKYYIKEETKEEKTKNEHKLMWFMGKTIDNKKEITLKYQVFLECLLTVTSTNIKKYVRNVLNETMAFSFIQKLVYVLEHFIN